MAFGARILGGIDLSWLGSCAGHYMGARKIGATPVNKRAMVMFLGLIYIVVGIVIAVSRHYITIGWLKTLASALLAVFLWWLVLLGVNLHLH